MFHPFLYQFRSFHSNALCLGVSALKACCFFSLLICVSRQFVDIFSVDDILYILAVLVLLIDLVCGHNFFLGDPAIRVGDLFQTRDLSVLVGLDGLNEVCGLN